MERGRDAALRTAIRRCARGNAGSDAIDRQLPRPFAPFALLGRLGRV